MLRHLKSTIPTTELNARQLMILVESSLEEMGIQYPGAWQLKLNLNNHEVRIVRDVSGRISVEGCAARNEESVSSIPQTKP